MDSERAADVLNAHAFVVPQYECRPFHRTQLLECRPEQFLELAAVRQPFRRRVISYGGCSHFLALFIGYLGLLHLAPLARADQIERTIGCDAVHPGSETGPAVKPVKLPLCRQER